MCRNLVGQRRAWPVGGEITWYSGDMLMPNHQSVCRTLFYLDQCQDWLISAFEFWRVIFEPSRSASYSTAVDPVHVVFVDFALAEEATQRPTPSKLKT